MPPRQSASSECHACRATKDLAPDANRAVIWDQCCKASVLAQAITIAIASAAAPVGSVTRTAQKLVMKIREAMHKGAECVSPDTSLVDVARRMKNSMPVRCLSARTTSWSA